MNDSEILILIQAGVRCVRCVHQLGLYFTPGDLYKTKFPQERSYQDGALTVTLTISYILASPIKKGLLVDSD